MPFNHILAWLRKRHLHITPIQVDDVRAMEAALRDFWGDVDGVSVVYAFPCERVQEELVAQEKFLFDLDVVLNRVRMGS